MLFKLADIACFLLADTIAWLMTPFARIYQYFAAKSNPEKRKTVFIVATDRLGDALVRLPFYIHLRTMYPRDQYRIVCALTEPIAALFAHGDLFDEIVIDKNLHDSHPLFWLFGRGGIVCPVLRWAFANKIDVFISMLRIRSLGCDFVCRFSRPEVRLAYSYKEMTRLFPVMAKAQKLLYDKGYSHLLESTMGVHQFDDFAKVESFLSGKALARPVACPEACRQALRLPDCGAETGFEDFAVLVPGAGTRFRQWPTRRFAELADRLGGNFVIVGSTTEKTLGDEIAARSKSGAKFVNLCGKTSLPQLGDLLAKASLVVTNETGTATYAAVIGAPTLCILGGGDFGAFFPNPYCRNTRSVYHKEPCFYCRWQCTKGCAHGAAAPCIDSISVDEVYDAVADLLKKDGCR